MALELKQRERVERAGGRRSVKHLSREHVVCRDAHALREPLDCADAAAVPRDACELRQRGLDRADVYENLVAEGGIHACGRLRDLPNVADRVLDLCDASDAGARLPPRRRAHASGQCR